MAQAKNAHLHLSWSADMFYFRVRGTGLHFRPVAGSVLTYSERTGTVRVRRVGPWWVKVLRPDVRGVKGG